MSQEMLRTGTLYFLVLLFSLSFHEFAHAFTAMKFGDDTAKNQGRLTLNPLKHLDFFGTLMLIFLAYQGIGIGWAKPVPVDPERLKSKKWNLGIISLLGPVSNLVLAFILFQLFLVFLLGASAVPDSSENEFFALISDFLQVGVRVNLVLFVFNLIPIYPLDGAKVLSGLLPSHLSNIYDRFFLRLGIWPLLILVLWEWILPFPGPISVIFKQILPFLMSILNYTAFWMTL